MIYFHQDVFANLYSKFHPWARVIDTQWLPQGHSTQTHSLTRYNQEKKQLRIIPLEVLPLVNPNPFGINGVNEGAVVNNTCARAATN